MFRTFKGIKTELGTQRSQKLHKWNEQESAQANNNKTIDNMKKKLKKMITAMSNIRDMN